MGREDGLSAKREERRLRPAFVRYGNWERGSNGTVTFPDDGVDEDDEGGRRRDLAFGKDLKLGQICCVGGPVVANIYLRQPPSEQERRGHTLDN